eukprot:6203713-Pleurochrysis_carterae.AAC.3
MAPVVSLSGRTHNRTGAVWHIPSKDVKRINGKLDKMCQEETTLVRDGGSIEAGNRQTHRPNN